MVKISAKDFLPWREYEKIRSQRISYIAELKKKRRIELGDRLTLLFENKEIVMHQIQEMIYLDRLERDSDIEREIRVYSPLLPCGGKIKATLYIHAYDQKDLDWVYKNLRGVYNNVILKVGNIMVLGEPEPGRETEDAFSTVQYLTFNLNGLKDTNLEIIVKHPNYNYSKKIDKELAETLIKEAYEDCE